MPSDSQNPYDVMPDLEEYNLKRLAKEKPMGHNLKSFNVVTYQSHSSVRVHPQVVLTICDAFTRRPEDADRCIGTLMGYVAEGGYIEVTDCFTVIHQDDKDRGVLMDQDYHRKMVNLRSKVNTKEQVLGWFCTGSAIEDSSVVIHNFYLRPDSLFVPQPGLPQPIHMIVDTSLENDKLVIKAFMNKDTSVAETLVQFHEIPLKIQVDEADKTGMAMLLRAEKKQQAKDVITDKDCFNSSMTSLLEAFKKIKAYTQDVIDGKIEGNEIVGRELNKVLCSEPFFDQDQFKNLCAGALQDELMVVYLSQLTRTQIVLAEKINSAYAKDM